VRQRHINDLREPIKFQDFFSTAKILAGKAQGGERFSEIPV